jgi:hypothetical protein
MLFNTPNSKIVNRLEFLTNYCSNKNVIHLGACQANDENDLSGYDELVTSEEFLHKTLQKISSRVIGIDYNEKFINYLNKNHGIDDIYFWDIEQKDSLSFVNFNPDIVLFGEILEHLSNPGFALRNIADNLMDENTKLVITIPNGLSAWNFFWALFGKEMHDPDHSLLFTPRIVSRLLEKNNLICQDIYYYHSTLRKGTDRNFYSPFKLFRLRSWVPFIFLNLLLRVNKSLSDGLIVIAKKDRK